MFLNEKLLHDEAHWIRDQYIHRAGKRSALFGAEPNRPWRNQEYFKVPQLLRGNTCSGFGDVWLPIPLYATSTKRRQKLGIEPGIVVAQDVVRDRRVIVTRQLFLETGGRQRAANVTDKRRVDTERQIRVPGLEWVVVGNSGEGMISIQAMGPPTNQGEMRSPGIDGLNQASQSIEVVHLAGPSTTGFKTLR